MRKEKTWDKLLQIHTIGRDDTHADQDHHPYEPTPYCVLERMAGCGLLRKDDVLLDYGCGKGRVGFFLSYRTKTKTIGIEYDEHIYQGAMENRASTICRVKPEFVPARAEKFTVPQDVSRCYFFNPFSVEILHKVMARILESWYDHPRDIFLFFYYPSDTFIAYLMTVDEVEFYDEIECDDLFPGYDERERVLIFRLPGFDQPAHAEDDPGQHRAVEFPAAVPVKGAQADDCPLLSQVRRAEAGCSGGSERVCRQNSGGDVTG